MTIYITEYDNIINNFYKINLIPVGIPVLLSIVKKLEARIWPFSDNSDYIRG